MTMSGSPPPMRWHAIANPSYVENLPVAATPACLHNAKMTEQLEIDRAFDASPDLLWRALTVPGAVEEWFWPFAMNARVDPRPGGVYNLAAPAMGMAMNGEVTAAQAPRRLSLTWRWACESEQTNVNISLTPTDDGTRLRLTHGGFTLSTTRDDHVHGWNDCLDRLPAWLEAHS
jgi:uncharacterized protein YndB with AHSA1/START domain